MKITTVIASAAASVLLAACASGPFSTGGAKGPGAVANLAPTKGNQTKGTVNFSQSGGKVLVTASVSGLPAGGSYGFHIHEKGDCSSDDAMSAGGHFNPHGKPHAAPTSPERHAGDMPMLTADASGNATLKTELDVISIGSGSANVVGRAVIVHKDPDDYKTQPTGNAGARLACGVIRAA